MSVFDRKCDDSYYFLTENLKYSAQFLYLAPSAVIQARILYVLLSKYRNFYMKQSFYVLFSMDCLASFILVTLDIFFARVFQYFPQLCVPLTTYLKVNTGFSAIYYPFQNYLHSAQPIIQIFLVLNRMSCVLKPMNYSEIWSKYMNLVIMIILLSPFLFIWNVIISNKWPIMIFGGFYIGYDHKVSWAGMTFFLMILRIITITVSLFCTIITVWKMKQMNKRIKTSERTLCIASFLISLCFFGTALAESLFVFNLVRTSTSVSYAVVPISWDILNIGGPYVMIFANKQLRCHVFNQNPKSISNLNLPKATVSAKI